MKWIYESDGDENRRTHYLVLDEIGDERIDLLSKRRAMLLCDALNEPARPAESLAQHVVRLIETAWPNLNIEGWDSDAAESIIRTVLARRS